MFSIGLTGGIGSGKTTVSDAFATHGIAVIDADLIAHRVTAPGGTAIASIVATFGQEFIGADGAMDRRRMREHVFADSGARSRLEAITHPLIRAETERQAASASGPYLLFVVPLLIESGSTTNRYSRVLVVDCPLEVQIGRVMRRNGYPREQVLTIIAAQASRERRLAVADDVISNASDDRAPVLAAVAALHQKYLDLAAPQT